MNQPEGYVLVQIKQLAQWREWANNVAAWSKQADRSSEVARLKASISSAMVSATLPPAIAAGDSGAGEREALQDLLYAHHARPSCQAGASHVTRCRCISCATERASAALATKPQA